MISLQIKDVKTFMAKLLMQPTFDLFQATEVTIATYNTFIIDGHIHKDFYSKEDMEAVSSLPEFSFWSKLRPTCFELIKGKRTPLSFKIVLQMPKEEASQFCASKTASFTDDNLKACVLTLKYDGTQLFCVTAASYTTFSLDKSSDAIWDYKVLQYFSQEAIDFDLQI